MTPDKYKKPQCHVDCSLCKEKAPELSSSTLQITATRPHARLLLLQWIQPGFNSLAAFNHHFQADLTKAISPLCHFSLGGLVVQHSPSISQQLSRHPLPVTEDPAVLHCLEICRNSLEVEATPPGKAELKHNTQPFTPVLQMSHMGIERETDNAKSPPSAPGSQPWN